MRIRWRLAGLIVAIAIVTSTAIGLKLTPRRFAATTAALKVKLRPITLKGAVIVNEADPVEQSPIGGALVTARDNLAASTATTTFLGSFSLPLRPSVLEGQLVTLQIHHPNYQPIEVSVPAGDQLAVIALTPTQVNSPHPLDRPPIELSNLIVRYTVQARTATNIGSAAKMFVVVNTGNLPCDGQSPCSPDGRWKATVGGVSLDAGTGNEFRNARLSCIAGPCPFTQVESDRFSRGGQFINATVRNWSDTTTFILEAEVFRPEITAIGQHSYPTILGRWMNFSLPPTTEGASIEAEIDGEQIVFPLGPTAALSWAVCEVRAQNDQTRMFRCGLKPEYAFKNYSR
jgi:hypothetical protein